MSNSERSLAASALFAGGPISDGRYPLARMLEYGQFVGVWDFDWRGRRSDGEWQTAEGEWHFYWALEGRAVCDTWIIPKLAARRQPEAPAGEYGLTVRFFDPAVDAWRVTWNGPVNGNVRRFTAQVRGSESCRTAWTNSEPSAGCSPTSRPTAFAGGASYPTTRVRAGT